VRRNYKMFGLNDKQKNNQKGFSLVEVLVAIAILGLIASAFIGSLSTGAIATRLQGEDLTARNLAQSQMEKLKAAVYDNDGATYSSISTPSGYSISISANPAIYTDTNIQKLTVTVSHNGSAVFSLEDYKVNR
jgi:prepilin-type N-terminal cleavage/methylation domain-containing protein